MKSPRLWLMTGERGAGKTKFCRAVAELARLAGFQVGGLISPGVFVEQEKVGIEVQDLATGEVRTLASREDQPPFTLVLGEWYFDPQVLEWGNIVLEGQLNNQAKNKTLDLLIIDEIGPLELLRQEGWTAALPLLNSHVYRSGLVVIRPELVETACSLLPALHGTITLEPGMDPQAEASTWWEGICHD